MEGVARLRISNDIEFEEETFIDMMRAAKEVNAFLQLVLESILMITFLTTYLQWQTRNNYKKFQLEAKKE